MQVDWEVFLDKMIERSSDFGIRGGKLAADGGGGAKEIGVELKPGELAGKKFTLNVTGRSVPSGLWLATVDGLPLLRLTDDAGYRRIAVERGTAPGSVRVFAGNGAVVAEYLIGGLAELVEIDAGEVTVP